MKNTKNEWTDASWNPVTGCLHNCEYCYARGIARRFAGLALEFDPCEMRYKLHRDAHVSKEVYNGMTLFEYDTPALQKTKRGNYGHLPYPEMFHPTFRRYALNKPQTWKTPPHSLCRQYVRPIRRMGTGRVD